MFYYDELNQLVRENVCTANCDTTPVGYTNEYLYDGFGNRTYVKTYNYTEAISLNGLTPINVSAYTYTYSWDDQLSTANGYTYSYDDSGNVSSMIDSVAGASIYYDWEGRELVGYEYTDDYVGFNVSYEYNDAGYRVARHINSGDYLYELEGDMVLVETIPGHVLYYTYDINGTLISVNIDGDEYFYKFNLFNDIIGLYDEYGDLVVTYFYDSWGNLLDMVDDSGTNAGSLNPYRYRSYRYDWETNLYYLNSRYYNPETGRFISADGLIGDVGNILSHNMYAYTENNPVTYVDPNGYTQEVGYGGSTLLDIDYVLLYCKDTCYFRGVLVIKHDDGELWCGVNGTTSCAYLNTIHLWSGEKFPNTLLHEYGHILQEQEIGELRYILNVGIPSMWGYLQHVKPYFLQPHEIIADFYGGVDRPGYDYTFDNIEMGLNQQEYGLPYTDDEIFGFFTDIVRFWNSIFGGD